MAGTLELSDQEFKTTMINTLRAIMGKSGKSARIERQCKERNGKLGKNPKKMLFSFSFFYLEIKSTVT